MFCFLENKKEKQQIHEIQKLSSKKNKIQYTLIYILLIKCIKTKLVTKLAGIIGNIWCRRPEKRILNLGDKPGLRSEMKLTVRHGVKIISCQQQHRDAFTLRIKPHYIRWMDLCDGVWRVLGTNRDWVTQRIFRITARRQIQPSPVSVREADEERWEEMISVGEGWTGSHHWHLFTSVITWCDLRFHSFISVYF